MISYMKRLIVLLLFCFLLSNTFSATITGEVFEWYNFEKLDNVIVEINTIPLQRDISTNGFYSFEVPAGEYHIIAEYYLEGELVYTDDQNIVVANEGNFVLDLIMFPELNFEDNLVDVDDINFENVNLDESLINDEKEENNLTGLLVSFVILGVLLVLLFLANKNLLPKTKKEKLLKLREGQSAEGLDKYARQVLDLLKKRGNRLTQKEIRDEISEIGEAKISLIIAELEHMGKIKKIKRGRGNIIVLKE